MGLERYEQDACEKILHGIHCQTNKRRDKGGRQQLVTFSEHISRPKLQLYVQCQLSSILFRIELKLKISPK